MRSLSALITGMFCFTLLPTGKRKCHSLDTIHCNCVINNKTRHFSFILLPFANVIFHVSISNVLVVAKV